MMNAAARYRVGPIGFDANRDVKSRPVILELVKGGFSYFH